jgi:alanine dehydrogenase
MVAAMRPGSVIIDVSVDQGACVETIHPTTHSNPVYLVDGVIHYGVTNMPAAVPQTSTYALTNMTLPYISKLARYGMDAVRKDPALARGVNTFDGKITYRAVAEAFGLPHAALEDVL